MIFNYGGPVGLPVLRRYAQTRAHRHIRGRGSFTRYPSRALRCLVSYAAASATERREQLPWWEVTTNIMLARWVTGCWVKLVACLQWHCSLGVAAAEFRLVLLSRAHANADDDVVTLTDGQDDADDLAGMQNI